MCDLGERPGQRRHPHHREGHPGLRVEDEDDDRGSQGLRHGDPGRPGGLRSRNSIRPELNWGSILSPIFSTFLYLP